MAKKTWIKIKRGLLEPKHIEKLAQAWYLYLYILDQADWETGTIKEWKDEYAANDLEKPIGMIREHRKKLELEKYIECEKNQHSQKIIIHNWTDPRRYDNHLLNPEIESMEKDELSNGEIIQSADQSSCQTILAPSQNSAPSYSHIITLTHKNNNALISNFVSISGVTYEPKLLDVRRCWNKTLQFLEDSGVTNEIMLAACEETRKLGKLVTDPDSIK
jgi:hypothetical protein